MCTVSGLGCPKSPYRISTPMLEHIDNVLKVAAGCLVYSTQPAVTLAGAFCGTAIRLISAKGTETTDESFVREDRTASVCFTLASAAFAYCTPQSTLAPFALGVLAAAGGYEIVRKLVD